ncbi:alpha-amylase [Elysia marginata]|uniref:alpha-amylase n=1 Tax=Elysia marginata TaxID=1093978 RepID=A0AAV4J3Y2_9GAST|nr:alpha-amylase [Elysia marginata]
MKWLNNFGDAWGMWASGDVVNFIDNHDNQRGHGGAGAVLTNWEPKPYKMATAFMLAWPYGVSRIMSSYNYDRNNKDQGPPHNGDMSIKTVSLSGMTCRDGWICEHRWRQIYNMVAFSNIAANSPVRNWWAGADYQIAFSRGDRAFLALNLENYDISQNLMTGLPVGKYCDVISGNLENGSCTGTTVDVDGSGRANIHVCSNCEDPMVAIHVEEPRKSVSSGDLATKTKHIRKEEIETLRLRLYPRHSALTTTINTDINRGDHPCVLTTPILFTIDYNFLDFVTLANMDSRSDAF